MDAGEPMHIHGVITQGGGSSDPSQWVTEFKVEYRLDEAVGSAVTLPGTFTMASAKQEHVFSTPLYARYIRIVVLAWNNGISMRAALLVRSCSSCTSNAFSEQGSTSVDACACRAGAYTDATAIKSRAMALVPGRAQFSTLANRGVRQYVSTAQFNSAMGPPGGAGATTFDRNLNEYIDGGSHTFNIATNGGFTIVALVMFTGGASDHERIFEFINETVSANRVLLKRGAGTQVSFEISGGNNIWCQIAPNLVIVQNTWQEFVVTYSAIHNILKLTIDNVVFSRNCPTPLTNRVFSSTRVGSLLTGSIAGLYMVDALLPEHEISATLKKMRTGEDLLQPCSSCEPGTYGTGLGQTSISACVDCEQGKHSPFSGAALAESCTTCPAMSSAPDRTTCQCNDGFSGNNTASCAMCAAGKYRGATSVTNWARACGDMKNEACPTDQTDIQFGRGSERAVDGHDCSTGGGFTHTDWQTGRGWWSIDLGLIVNIRDLSIMGRLDSFVHRTENYTIYVGNDNSVDGRFVRNSVCVEKQRALSNIDAQKITCNTPISGRYLFFVLQRAESLALCEVEIFSSDCALCPANSISPPGSVLLQDCKCNAGYTGPDGGLCTVCEPGSYKSGTGSASCVICPQNSNTKPTKTTNLFDCQCNAGYQGPDGGECLPCAAGTFKLGLGPTCSDCPDGTYGTQPDSVCINCPHGKYNLVPGAASSDMCLSCGPGKFYHDSHENALEQ